MSKLFLILFLILNPVLVLSDVLSDTTKSVSSKLVAGLNFSFLNLSNWQGADYNSLLFASDVEYSYIKSNEFTRDFLSLKLELGFTKFLDSTWYKHSDDLNGQYILKIGKRKTSQTASCNMNAKLLNSYLYYTDNNSLHRKKQSGTFFSPSTLETGYGVGYTFLKQSIVNFSLATARIRVLYNDGNTLNENAVSIAKFDNSTVKFDYGFSLQYNIMHDLTKNLSFFSNGKMFLKGMHRDKVEMDITQKWLFRVTNFLQLKTDVKIVYAPVASHKLQFRNEFLFGFYFDSALKKN